MSREFVPWGNVKGVAGVGRGEVLAGVLGVHGEQAPVRPAPAPTPGCAISAPSVSAAHQRQGGALHSALREWTYARAYASSSERSQAIDPWLQHYNHHRSYAGIHSITPAARLNNLLETTARSLSTQGGFPLDG